MRILFILSGCKVTAKSDALSPLPPPLFSRNAETAAISPYFFRSFAEKSHADAHDSSYLMAQRSRRLPAAPASGTRYRTPHRMDGVAAAVPHGRGGGRESGRVTRVGTHRDGSPDTDGMHRRQLHVVPGVVQGPQQAGHRLHLGSLEKIREAGIEELKAAPSMNEAAAMAVYRFFRES